MILNKSWIGREIYMKTVDGTKHHNSLQIKKSAVRGTAGVLKRSLNCDVLVFAWSKSDHFRWSYGAFMVSRHVMATYKLL